MKLTDFSDSIHRTLPKKMTPGEILLIGCSLASLVISCVIWSSRKQAWMDEIFTWKEVSDPSLLHLYYAIQHGADGGMPVFYTTAWAWAKVLGGGVLTLRLYSCAAMCGALVVTWRTIRRFYGVWATGFGVLAVWGASTLLLEQNAEARFYGLYLLAVAVAVNVYARLITEATPKTGLLLAALLCQAGLVLSHVLGLIYSGLILLALILFDGRRHRFRYRLYGFHAAGWLALLVWIPAIRASMANSKPRAWIAIPAARDLLAAYLFQSSERGWFASRGHAVLHIAVFRATLLIVFVPLVSVFLLELRRALFANNRTVSDSKSDLLLVAYALLAAPLALFALSLLITPIFMSRYLLPSVIGLSIVLASFADRLGAGNNVRSRKAWVCVLFLLIPLPVISALALPPVNMDTYYLDVRRLEGLLHSDTPVVVSWGNDFMKIMRTVPDPNRYYYMLDWPAALIGPSGNILHYHLLLAYRNNGYFTDNIQESHRFLCSHPDFLVLDYDAQSWFDLTIRRSPQFEWKVLDTLDAVDLRRNLIAVHRRAPLAFCDLP